jgi:hypothetical protein
MVALPIPFALIPYLAIAMIAVATGLAILAVIRQDHGR